MKEAASSLQRPPTSIPRTTKQHREFRRSSGQARSLALRASWSVQRGSPARVSDTKAVSTANWATPQSAKPLAMTSMRRSSMWWTCWTLRSASRVWVVTRAPASRHTLAAARSSGLPRLRSAPDWAQAARWSPRESKVRRHRQVRANSGRGSRSRRRSRIRKRWDG